VKDINKYLLAILIIALPFIVVAQPSNLELLTNRQLKVLGKNALNYGDIYSAIDYFEKYCEVEPTDYEYIHKLAELYRISRDYKNAEIFYSKLNSEAPNKFADALYYFALMQKMNGKYSESLESFNKYKKSGTDQNLKKLTKVQIEGIELAEKQLKNKRNVDLTRLDNSINKPYIEFSPIPVSNNKMIYASYKADSIKYYDVKDSKKPVRKFYEANRTDNVWVAGEELTGPFNNDSINTGNGAFSTDGNRFYFTRSITNDENKIITSIYMSEKNEGKWKEPKKLERGINDIKFSSTQPAIGRESKKDLEVIYFVSDRPGGKGGLDIWYMIYDTQKNLFKGSVNAGTKINTSGDEITPYYDARKRKLYFSSNGLPSVGGFDIFISTGELAKWSAPTNIGIPVNSSADDIYYAPATNQKEAFFTSNREGGAALKNPTCCDDIYTVGFLDLFFINLNGIVYKIEEEDLETKITEEFIKNNLCDEAIVSLYIYDEETSEPILTQRDTTNSVGEYKFELERGRDYKIVASKDGYFNATTVYSTLDAKAEAEVTENAKPLGLKKIPKKAIIIDNIYYEFDKSELTVEAKSIIDTTIFFIMSDTPDIIVELSSHTDSCGTDAYNMKLSQSRAESVVKYLVEKGIEKSRLLPKGYGETRFIAKNTNPDGSDNPEGRAKNRRTEFTVIGSSNQYSILNKNSFEIKTLDGKKGTPSSLGKETD
jgi:outer membrane protein OmpA-like peptidoglycan-associated protein/tetratricopeptide (TPR) repeat protein